MPPSELYTKVCSAVPPCPRQNCTQQSVAQSHRVPVRTVHSSFKHLVMLQLFAVPDCYRQPDNISSNSSVQLSCCMTTRH